MYNLDKKYIEVNQDWIKILDKIPYLTFPTGYEVRIVPPFHGAVVRFKIRNPKKPLLEISVYLDWYSNLGYCGAPYWEIYLEETERFGLNQTKEMMNRIEEILGCK